MKIDNLLKREILDEIDNIPDEEILPKLEILYNQDPTDVDVLKELAFIHFNRNELAKSFHFILNVLDANPADMEALKCKAWIYKGMGNNIQFVAALETIVDFGILDSQVFTELAQEYMNQNYYLDALITLVKTLNILELNLIEVIDIAVASAVCYGNLGAIEISKEIIDSLFSIIQNDPNSGETMKFLGDLKTQLATTPVDFTETGSTEINQPLGVKDIAFDFMGGVPLSETDAVALNNLVDQYMEAIRNHDYLLAKRIAEDAIEIEASIPWGWNALADANYLLIDLPEALDACENALSKELAVFGKYSMQSLNTKGMTLFAQGYLDDALNVFSGILLYDSSEMTALIYKARIYNRLGWYQKAIDLLLPALDNTRHSHRLGLAHYVLALAYQKLNMDKEFKSHLEISFKNGCEFGTRLFRILNPDIDN